MKYRQRKPSLHWNYKKGRVKCKECGKETEYLAKLCRGCYDKDRKLNPTNTGKNNPMWTGGKPKCLECNKPLKSYKAKRRGKCVWKDEEWVNSILKKRMLAKVTSPNKPETTIKNLLANLFPNEYDFVGNGELVIGAYCPDFVNKDNTKIIEHYGCYWHKCPKCNFGNRKPKDKGRLKVYNKHGYETLIIWEHELKDIRSLQNKLLEFNKGG